MSYNLKRTFVLAEITSAVIRFRPRCLKEKLHNNTGGKTDKMRRVSMDALEFDKKISELSFDENAETNAELVEKVKKSMLKVIKNELTPRQKEIIMLYYYERLGISEIAERLGVVPSTVSRTIKRAREKIYRFLKYYYL